MNETELEKTVDELENKVLEEIGENPFRTYKVQFPYQVRFVLDDEPETEIVINTKSEEHYYSRTPKDVLWQKELSDSHSKLAIPKYLINHLNENLYKVEPENCHVTMTGKPEVEEMTEAELVTFQRQIIDANE